MYHYSIVQWLFFFYFYCFFGWCFESTYVSLKSKHFVNRGFMKGPFLPLYGSGAIILLVCSMPFSDNLFLVYLAGCVGATALEYVTGVTMEALFKVRYWDYSYRKIQFQGHICLVSTLAWGVLTIVMTQFVHKLVENIVLSISSNVLTGLTFVLTATVFADFAISFKEAMDVRDILIKLEKAKEEMQHMQKRLDVMIAFTGEDIAERKEEFLEKATELADAIGVRKDFLMEKTSGLLETIGEKKDELVDKTSGIADSLGEYKALLTNQMAQYMSGLENKRVLLTEQVEKHLKYVVKGNPTMSSEYFRESIEEIKKKNMD